jgi:hypothetical protein
VAVSIQAVSPALMCMRISPSAQPGTIARRAPTIELRKNFEKIRERGFGGFERSASGSLAAYEPGS